MTLEFWFFSSFVTGFVPADILFVGVQPYMLLFEYAISFFLEVNVKACEQTFVSKTMTCTLCGFPSTKIARNRLSENGIPCFNESRTRIRSESSWRVNFCPGLSLRLMVD